MSYRVKDPEKIEGYVVFFSLSSGERVRVMKQWEKREEAEAEASKLPGGKASPKCGWKTIETHYPTCPKCGHQGESEGIRDFSYNGGGESFRCLNEECGHEWVWA